VRVPQVTLVHYYGHSVLLVALPASASFVVALMLWMSVAKRSRAAGIGAWIVAVIVLAAGIIGFFTFLFTIGLAMCRSGSCSSSPAAAHPRCPIPKPASCDRRRPRRQAVDLGVHDEAVVRQPPEAWVA
jgi:hypothetical protein